MAGPSLVLHVGHAKTGSSALQAQLANSVEQLAGAGVTYPWHKAMAQARKGHISTGNVDVEHVVEAYDAACAAHPGAARLLFSNEALTSRYYECTAPFEELIRRGVRVEMILFIRNPLSHALSSYGQEIKRGGATGDVAGKLRGYASPARIGGFLTRQREAGVEVSVANYSNHSGALGQKFCQMLGVPEETLQTLEVAKVNRSLTASELYIQRVFNRTWGPRSNAFVSDQLCNRLPDLPVSKPRISAAQYDAFRERMLPMLAQVNPMLPPDEAYAMEPPEAFCGTAGDEGDIRLTPEQVEVLAEAISARLPSVETTDAFFDVVEGLRGGRALCDDDVMWLTRMAKALRPGTRRLSGPVVHRDEPVKPTLIRRVGTLLGRGGKADG